MVAPSSTSITPVAAGASVAPGASVAGASVAGISVAGASVAGASVAGGASVVAGPHADSANAVISKMLQNIDSFLFILLLSFDFVCLRSQTYQRNSIRILQNHLLCESVCRDGCVVFRCSSARFWL